MRQILQRAKPGKRWYVKKNPQSQWIAGFLVMAGDEGFEQEYMLKNTGKINRFLSR